MKSNPWIYAIVPCKALSPSVPLTPRSQDEILQSSNLKSFGFNDLRTSTRNFRPDNVPGEGGFGYVFKGWIDKKTFTAAKPGIGMKYNATLSDFGLAKDGPVECKSHVSKRVMGTYGYAAPEYMVTGHLKAKSDIYSFGVVLMEMLMGRRVVDKNCPPGEQNLIPWPMPYLTSKRRIFQVMDARIQGQYSLAVAARAGALAVKCLALDPKHRPNMGEVVKALEQLQELKDYICTKSTGN
ncbi:hypothetical protein LguiB_027358 [Lonicera macranthoides]